MHCCNLEEERDNLKRVEVSDEARNLYKRCTWDEICINSAGCADSIAGYRLNASKEVLILQSFQFDAIFRKIVKEMSNGRRAIKLHHKCILWSEFLGNLAQWIMDDSWTQRSYA